MNEYIRTCAEVMMTAATVVVVAVAIFICFTLVLWGASMLRNFIAANATPLEQGDEIFIPMNGQPTSSNGSGMRRQHFPTDGA